MDVFGGGWEGYVDKLREGFRAVRPEDTVVLCGDLSWAMGLEEGARDFAFLDALPGPQAAAEGKPRLLVEYLRKNEPLFCGARLEKPEYPSQ